LVDKSKAAFYDVGDEGLRGYRNILDVKVIPECQIAGGFSSCIYKVFLSQDRTGVGSQSETSLEH